MSKLTYIVFVIVAALCSISSELIITNNLLSHSLIIKFYFLIFSYYYMNIFVGLNLLYIYFDIKKRLPHFKKSIRRYFRNYIKL